MGIEPTSEAWEKVDLVHHSLLPEGLQSGPVLKTVVLTLAGNSRPFGFYPKGFSTSERLLETNRRCYT